MKKKYIDIEQIQFHYLPISAIGDVYALKNEIDEIPTADVQEVKHGKWEQQTEPLRWRDVDCAECSICGESYILNEYMDIDDIRYRWKYCPNCGARMDGKDEGND